jgi:hypothetical protein
VTRDRVEHNLLDRPRDRPVRSAIGVGVLTFYVLLFGAGAQDIWAQHLGVAVTSVRDTFRVLLFVVPIATALFTWKLCRDLAASFPIEEYRTGGEPPIGPNEPEEGEDESEIEEATVDSAR